MTALSPSLSRRAWLTGALTVSVAFSTGCSLPPPIPKRPQPTDDDALGWIGVSAQGRLRLYSPRMEMGQNILSALRELASIELGVPAQAIDVRLPSTQDISRVKATVGSDSVGELWLPLARACYTLRQALLDRAAQRLNQSASGLTLLGDEVTGNSASISLAELATPTLVLQARDVPPGQLRVFAANADKRPPAPMAQLDGLLRGQPLFTADIRLPNMLYAVVLRSPWADAAPGDSPLKSWNEAAVRAVPGFHAVVRHPRLAGPALVATRMGAVQRLHDAAQAQWQAPPLAVADPQRLIDVDAQTSFTKTTGLVPTDIAWTIDLRLDVPLASHAFIEPRCAVARFDAAGSLQLWCGSQDTFYVRDTVARELGLSHQQVQIHAMRMGGAFGGKTIVTVEREAALIAQAMGRAVKVQWSRADEFQAGFHRPPSSHRLRLKLAADAANELRISHWQHTLSTSHVLFTNAVLPPWLQQLTSVLGDDGAARGQLSAYDLGQQQRQLKLIRLPVLTGPWRGLGAGPNNLSIELAMDAAARAANQDPVAFRLAHLRQRSESGIDWKAGDPQRLARCLEAAARLETKTPFKPAETAQTATNSGATNQRFQATGVGCGVYKGKSYAAAVAQVALELNAKGQLIALRVLKIWCAHDCGRMLDADSVRAQVEGNLIWSMGMVLFEQLNAPAGTPAQTSLADYPLPRMADTPQMDIELIASSQAPTGAGETAIVAGAGAICNAVFRALLKAGLSLPTAMPIRLRAVT